MFRRNVPWPETKLEPPFSAGVRPAELKLRRPEPARGWYRGLLTAIAVRVFESAGLDREQAINALQKLRALVRGFVLHEMTASFLDTVDYDHIYAVAVDVFIRGLDALRSSGRPA
jgi:hypothetical protein